MWAGKTLYGALPLGEAARVGEEERAEAKAAAAAAAAEDDAAAADLAADSGVSSSMSNMLVMPLCVEAGRALALS